MIENFDQQKNYRKIRKKMNDFLSFPASSLRFSLLLFLREIDENSVGFVTLAGLALFLFCLFLPDNSDDSALLGGTIRRQYNDTYPLTPPVVIGKEKKFKICLIADPDTSSRNEDQVSFFSTQKMGRTLD